MDRRTPALEQGAEADQATARVGPEQLAVVRRCLSTLAVLGIGSMVGVAFSLYLVNHYPLLLIALSPLGRHLVLVAPIVDPVAFVGVALVRRMAFYLTAFYLGRALGPGGITWLTMTGPTVSALAGISGMRTAFFVPLATLGLVVRLLLVLGFAELLREPIERLLSVIDEYWIPGTAVLATGVAIHQWRRIAKARQARAQLRL
jgi:hypothetical protein